MGCRSMRRRISGRYILAAEVIAAALNAVGVILGTVPAVILGLILGILQINMIGTVERGERRTVYLILGTVINTGLCSLLLIGYCSARINPVCGRNPIILSIIPGALLGLVGIPSLINDLTRMLRTRMN